MLYWYAFHDTASFGADRPKIQQAEFLRLPFPTPGETQRAGRAEAAGAELASLVDTARSSVTEDLTMQFSADTLLGKLDSLTYDYFGLAENEIALVEDSVEKIIPCVQPHRGDRSRSMEAS